MPEWSSMIGCVKQCRDYAVIEMETEARFQFDTDDVMIASALISCTYENFTAVNGFSCYSRFSALNDYKIALAKANNELPSDCLHASDPNLGFGREWHQFVQKRANKENIVLPPLEVPIQPQSEKSSAVVISVMPQVSSVLIRALLSPSEQFLLATSSFAAFGNV